MDVEQIEAAPFTVNAKLEPGGRAFKAASPDIVRLSPSYELLTRKTLSWERGQDLMPLRDPSKTELLLRAQMTPPLQLHTAVEVQEKSAPLIEGDRCLFLCTSTGLS